LARKLEVADILAAAGGEALILDPPYRLSDAELGHGPLGRLRFTRAVRPIEIIGELVSSRKPPGRRDWRHTVEHKRQSAVR